MSSPLHDDCPMAGALAVRLRESKRELTTMWLDRISARVAIDANRVFPTDELLDHVPLLIDGIADYVENPAAEISVDMAVVAKAMELGALRHKQGFDAYEILKEYEILGGILFHLLFEGGGRDRRAVRPRRADDLRARLFRAVTIIQQATMTHFPAARRSAHRRARRAGCAPSIACSRTRSRTGSAPSSARAASWKTTPSPKPIVRKCWP